MPLLKDSMPSRSYSSGFLLVFSVILLSNCASEHSGRRTAAGPWADVVFNMAENTKLQLTSPAEVTFQGAITGCLSGYELALDENKTAIKVQESDRNCYFRLHSMQKAGEIFDFTAISNWATGSHFYVQGHLGSVLTVRVIQNLSPTITGTQSVVVVYGGVEEGQQQQHQADIGTGIAIQGANRIALDVGAMDVLVHPDDGAGLFSFVFSCLENFDGTAGVCAGESIENMRFAIARKDFESDLTLFDCQELATAGGLGGASGTILLPGSHAQAPGGGMQVQNLKGPARLYDGDNAHLVLAVTSISTLGGCKYFPIEILDPESAQSTTPAPGPDDLIAQIAGNPIQQMLESYGGANQDKQLVVTFDADHEGLSFVGNGWKKISIPPYTVTPDTVLSFEFKGDLEGEIHGLGLDNDDTISAAQTFRVWGTQNWGISDYDIYNTPGTWQTWHVPVGFFFTGVFDRLLFVNDHDAAPSNAAAAFRNISLSEDAGAYFPALQIEKDGLTSAYPIMSFGGHQQDLNLSVNLEDNDTTLSLFGNGWKRFAINTTLTATSVLEFDVRIDQAGEIQGIGFSNGNSVQPDEHFKLVGSQNWGIRDYENNALADSNWHSLSIPVGEFLTGAYTYLTISNDHDVATPNAHLRIRNVRIFNGLD